MPAAGSQDPAAARTAHRRPDPDHHIGHPDDPTVEAVSHDFGQPRRQHHANHNIHSRAGPAARAATRAGVTCRTVS